MAVLMKCLMGSTCAVTGCCSIGLPVFMNEDGGLSSFFKKVSSEETKTQVIVERCQRRGGDTESSSIEFGNKEIQKACWKFHPRQNEATVISYEDKVNSLFQTGWTQGEGWSSFRDSPWKATCVSGGKGWALTQPGEGEYLGLCEQSVNHERVENTQITFLHKQTEGGKVKQIKLCVQDCWEDNVQSTELKNYQTAKSASWVEVKFQKSK